VNSKEGLSKQKQLSASSVTKSSGPLPKIEYDRKRLEAVIKYVSLSDVHKEEISKYLNTIDNEVEKLKLYLTEEKLSDFYEMMQASILDINNTATAIFQIVNKYETVPAKKIKTLIEEWFNPLEKELSHRLAMPLHVRDELELKTKRLYAQQSYVARSATIQQALMQHLTEISASLKKVGEPSPRCYISYAWPSQENKDKEYWIQPFLYILYDHLKAAGIDIVMDVHDIKPGESIFQFMGQYKKNGNHIILVGSESLLQKHYRGRADIRM